MGIIAYSRSADLKIEVFNLQRHIISLEAKLTAMQENQTAKDLTSTHIVESSIESNLAESSLTFIPTESSPTRTSHTMPQPTTQQNTQVAPSKHTHTISDSASDSIMNPSHTTPHTTAHAPFPQTKSSQKDSLFSFERIFTQKVMVFVAGIFFILAAFFLIIYSLEHELITPAVRIGLCIGFGFMLMGFGFMLHINIHAKVRKSRAITLLNRITLRILPNSSPKIIDRISQTLIGSGFVVLFFSFYGGFKLYGFFGALTTFWLLGVSAFLAPIICTRFGLIIGIFGLLGGFATPILLSNSSYNAPFLFSYLTCFYLLSCYFAIYKSQSRLLLPICWLLLWLYVFDFVLRQDYTLGARILCFMLIFMMFISSLFMLTRLDSKNTESSILFNPYFYCFMICAFISLVPFSLYLISFAGKLGGLEYAFLALLCIITLLLPRLKYWNRHIGEKLLSSGIIFSFCLMFITLIGANAYFGTLSVFVLLFVIGILGNFFISAHKIWYLWLLFGVILGYVGLEYVYSYNPTSLNVIAFAIVADYSPASLCFFVLLIFTYHYIAARPQYRAKNIKIDALLWLLCAISLILLSTYHIENALLVKILNWYHLKVYALPALLCALYATLGKGVRIGRISLLERDIAGFMYIIFFVAFVEFIYTDLSSSECFAFFLGVPEKLTQLSTMELILYALSLMFSLWILRKKDFRYKSVFFGAMFFVLLIVYIILFQALLYDVSASLHIRLLEQYSHYPISILCIGLCLKYLPSLRDRIYAKALDSINHTLKYAFSMAFGVFLAKFILDLCCFLLLVLSSHSIAFTSTFDVISAFVWILFGVGAAMCALWWLCDKTLWLINMPQSTFNILKRAQEIIIFILLLGFIVIFVNGVSFIFTHTQVDLIFARFYPVSFSQMNWLEVYAYSFAFVFMGVVLLILCLKKDIKIFRFYSLGLFIIAALKVFFIDASSFSSIAKIILFLVMGVVFLGVSLVYSKFIFHNKT